MGGSPTCANSNPKGLQLVVSRDGHPSMMARNTPHVDGKIPSSSSGSVARVPVREETRVICSMHDARPRSISAVDPTLGTTHKCIRVSRGGGVQKAERPRIAPRPLVT